LLLQAKQPTNTCAQATANTFTKDIRYTDIQGLASNWIASRYTRIRVCIRCVKQKSGQESLWNLEPQHGKAINIAWSANPTPPRRLQDQAQHLTQPNDTVRMDEAYNEIIQ
jgi:hypothetical protein